MKILRASSVLFLLIILAVMQYAGCGKNNFKTGLTNLPDTAAPESTLQNGTEPPQTTDAATTKGNGGLPEPLTDMSWTSEAVRLRKTLYAELTPDNNPSRRQLNYSGYGPDFPVAGKIYFTSLAKAIIGTAGEDEEMYFFVGVMDYSDNAKNADYYGYLYNKDGTLSGLRNESQAAATELRLYVEKARASLKITYDEIQNDTRFNELLSAYAGKLLIYERAAAEAKYSETYNSDYLARCHDYISYFEGIGFLQLGDISDIDWQFRLSTVSSVSIGYIAGRVDFAVSGTLDDLEKLCLELPSSKYGLFIYASSPDGYFFEHNAPVGTYSRMSDIVTKQLFYYPPDWRGQIYYSCQELGIYERIWCD